MQKCKEIIRKYIMPNKRVVVSCSGGPDSMCLLKNLIDLKDELNLRIIVAHINHNVRKESDDEEKMVCDYAKKNNLKFECFKIEKYSKENFHNEARIIRYNFMKKIISKYNASYLLTAHHGDDLIETILMRIARGSNLKGYSGFEMVVNKDNYQVIRPLIYNTKEEIIKYNDINNIPYALDITNYSDDYTRNRYRNHILPFLKKEDKDIHLRYLDYSKKLIEADSYINNIVNKQMKKIYKNNKLYIPGFIKLDDLIRRRIIEKIIYYNYGDDLFLVGNKNLDEINALINRKGNCQIDLPKDYIAIKEYDYLSIKGNKTSNNYNEILTDFVMIPNMGRISLTDEVGNSNYYLKLDSKSITLPLIVRNRCDGDIIEVKNLKGSQKVKKIFIDSKVSKEKRNLWPIVCDSNNVILWVPGLKKSKFDKSNEELYDIIIKYEEEKNEY